MKLFVLASIMILLLPISNYAQPRNDSAIYFNGLFKPEPEQERIQYFGYPRKIKDKLYEVTFYTLDSQKVATGEFKRKNVRNRNGVFVLYNGYGNIIITAIYRKGILNGVYQKFHANGNLSDSGLISKGNFIGIWKSWHPNGRLKEQRNYEFARGVRGSLFSVLTKEFKSYYPDGNPEDSCYYRNNYRHGIWFEWLESGTIRSVGEYKNGWKKGTWKYYNAKGKLLYLRRFSSLKYDDEGERIEIK